MSKVAVIIPAYNAERGLERSVESVLSQTLNDFEVWITDDGSTDRTGAIADALARRDNRVKVLHQSNAGCYQARLNALKLIRAPYFAFADADDAMEPTMLEEMYSFAVENKLDVVRCSYDGVLDPAVCFPNKRILENRESVVAEYVIPAMIRGTLGGTFVWNKLYRNQYDFSLFDKTDHVTNFEDLIFNLHFFLPVSRMGFLNAPLYRYEMVAGSAVHSFSQGKLKDFKEVLRIRRKLLPQFGVDVNGRDSREWFWRNRNNCIKSVVRAGNLSSREKISLVYKLTKEVL